MTRKERRMIAATVAVAVMLSGCAAPKGVPGASSDDCDPAKTALAGAALGALVGAMSGKGKTAAVAGLFGGAVGALACLAINAQSRQTKTAAAAEREYATKQGALPVEPKLVSYQTRVDPSGTIRADTDVRVRTNVEVVRGIKVPVREVKEEIVFYDTTNKEFKRGSKVLSEGAGGSYETDWRFKLPSGVTQGQYRVQTLMYVNGQMVAQRDTTMQLVMLSDVKQVAQAL